MGNQAKRNKENRTLTVDFNSEATYHRLCQDGKAFVEFVIAFIMSIGFQLKHKCSCPVRIFNHLVIFISKLLWLSLFPLTHPFFE